MSIENAVASTDLKHLTRQFYSAKALIISQQETIKHYSQKDFDTNERRIKALQHSLDSEREMNAKLTAELAELESKCERQARCNKELDKTNNELEKERNELLQRTESTVKSFSMEAHNLEQMANGLKCSIDFWHKNTSNKMQGHIEHGILGKRPVENPDSIPVYILQRDRDALLSQAAKLKEAE